jgi:hypothetical protein
MRTLIVVVCLLASACLSVAQSERGTIDGTVFDRIGHKVASAAVEAKNVATGSVFTTQSDERGVYALTLPSGTYEVSVAAVGHTSIQQGIVVTPARPLHGIDVVLAIP